MPIAYCRIYFVLLTAFVLSSVAFLIFADGSSWYYTGIFGITYCALCILFHKAYTYFFQESPWKKIQAYDDKLKVATDKGEIFTPFAQVKKIDFFVYRNIGGLFILVLQSGKRYVFTVVLERLDYILDAIIKYNPSIMQPEVFKKL